MNRRDFLRSAAAFAAAAVARPRRATAGTAAAPEQPPADAAAEKPNIVFFLIDDLGWRDVGCFGSRFYETPNVDRLAQQGMRFTSAYSNGPNCAPTRACLMSGQYSPRHGVYTVGTAARGNARGRKLIPVKNTTTLRGDIVTIAEALKPAGYVSASMGKWHLGSDALGPIGQGFDVNVGGNRAGHPRSYFSPYRNKDLADGPKGEYLTDRLTDEAIKFIEANKDRRFFLYLPHYAVHTPLQAKKDLIAKYRSKKPAGGQGNAVYAAMIDSTDQGIGRVLAALDRLHLAERTVVIFFSDNGGVGGITSMAPLRGAKGMLYEGGVRVPLIVRWPGKVKAASVCEEPVIGVDFYPTLLELAGAPEPKQTLDGVSIVPLLRQAGGLKREAIYWHFPAYLQGRGGRNKNWRTTPAGAVRAGSFKLLEFFEDGGLELYDLDRDIGEKSNLAEKMPDKTRELHAMLVKWRKAVKAPVPTEKNPQYDPTAAPKGGRRKKRRKKGAGKKSDDE